MVLSATISSTHVETGIRIDAGSLASTTTQLTVFLTTEHVIAHNDPTDENAEDGQLVLNDPKHGNLIYSMPLPLSASGNSSLIISAADLIEGVDYTVALEVVGTDAAEEGIVQLENVRYVAPPTITDEVFTVQVGDQALFIGIANENPAVDGFKIYINGKFTDAPTKFAYKTVIKTVDNDSGRYLLANASAGRIDGIGLVNDNTYEVSYRKYSTSSGSKLYSAMSATFSASPTAVAANPPQDLSIVVGKALIDGGYSAVPTDQTFVTVFQEGVPAENYPFTSYIFEITNSGTTFYALKNVDTGAGGEALVADLQDPSKNYVLFNDSAFTYYDAFNSLNGTVFGNFVDFNTVVLDGQTITCTIYSRNESGTSNGTLSNSFTTSGLPAQVTVFSTATGEANVSEVDMNNKVRVTFTPPDANGSAITGYTFKIAGGNLSVPSYFTKANADLTTDGTDRYIDFTTAYDNGVSESLENGLSYTVTITAINANGDSTESATSDAFIPSTKPSAPTGLVGTPEQLAISILNSGEIKLDWNNDNNQVLYNTVTNGSAITAYVLQVYEDGVGQVGGNITVDDTINTYTVGSLVNGRVYTISLTAVNANGQSTATVSNQMTPSAFPTFTQNSTAKLTAGLRNTYIGLIGGNVQYFQINIDTIDDDIDDGGYAITHYRIDVESSDGNADSTRSVTVEAANIANTQTFSLENTRLTITDDIYTYTVKVYPYNNVYSANNSSTSAPIHFTTTILDLVGGVTVALDGVDTQTLNFAWSIYAFDSIDQYTEGTTFDVALFASIPTLQPDGYTISYSAFTQQSTSTINIVSGTTDYTKQYADLEYGWKYMLQVTVNSQQYGADTNSNLPAVTSPDASESAEGVPNDKPTITVNEGTGVLTIVANGTHVSEVLVLSTNNDRTAVESYLTAVRSEATASLGNVGVSNGLIAFNNYMDNANTIAYVASVNINGNLGGDKNHLTIVENAKGVTLELNGTPLGLSKP